MDINQYSMVRIDEYGNKWLKLGEPPQFIYPGYRNYGVWFESLEINKLYIQETPTWGILFYNSKFPVFLEQPGQKRKTAIKKANEVIRELQRRQLRELLRIKYGY